MEKMGGAGLGGPQPEIPFLRQNECESSPFDHQSIFMKVQHFMFRNHNNGTLTQHTLLHGEDGAP